MIEPVSTDSKHIKSSVLGGVASSVWRAMMSPREFQGEPSQQGGAFILGPGQFDNGRHNGRTDRPTICQRPMCTDQ